MSLIPVPFLFRAALPVARIDALPRKQTPLLKLPVSTKVPFPAELNGQPCIAELRMAWNPQGLALSFGVQGKRRQTEAHPAAIPDSSGVSIWLDTRDTRANHRASRFCHLLHLMPLGGGTKGQDPYAVQLPVPRASEDAPLMDIEAILLEGDVTASSWRVDAWLPSEVLHGYDPLGLGRIGFYCHVRDPERGHALFSVGEDFPFSADPALWTTLELQRDG